MKRAIAVIGALLTIVLLVIGLSPREPAYQGKSLTQWAQVFGSNNWGGNRELGKEAEFAIRQIGTNGIPFLLERMQTRDTLLKKKVRQAVPASWHAPLHLQDNSAEFWEAGAHGISGLGTNAAGAIPALIEIARSHPEERGRYLAVFALRTIGPAAEPAIPFFMECLTNETAIIRDEAVIGLGNIRHRPEVVVPLLADFLTYESADTFELQDALFALGCLGAQARPAIPAMLELLDHQDNYVRDTVTNSLRMINSQGSTQSVPFSEGEFLPLN